MAPRRKAKISELMSSSKMFMETAPDISKECRAVISSLVDAVQLLVNELSLNSTNSSKPPSTDRQVQRTQKKVKGVRAKKPGGQKGHTGSRLMPFKDPTHVEELTIDRTTLPPGKWRRDGVEKRQVVDIEVSFSVTEFQAEILVNERGDRYTAAFPAGVTESVQYGTGVRATSVYLSQYQLVPQARVQDILSTQYGLSVAKGSVNNFNIYGANKLRDWGFEDWLKSSAISSSQLHADETGINIGGVGYWMHCLSNEVLTYFHVDPKRGKEAMEAMGVLPFYDGVLIHDHWKAYFSYLCTHVLCNAHHLRELERAYEQDGQRWAIRMKVLLLEINEAVIKCNGKLDDATSSGYLKRYRKILFSGMVECPENLSQRAQSKSRNLLERLLAYEEETLMFMTEEGVPFTNNQGERDLRMNKVQQKISGCFQSIRGARDFALIRSYLSTCRKNGVHPMEALRRLFDGDPPEFMQIKQPHP